MLTSGYELTTAITNLIIFITSVFCYTRIKNNKLWKMFYLLMCLDSFMGVIVHGLNINNTVLNVLWIILSILFTITINTLLCIFLKFKYKYIYILSVILSIILITFLLLNLDYILAFVLYVLVSFIVIGYFLIKNYSEKDKLILIGFIVQLIGGILMLCKMKFWILDYNGICHLFTAATLILFYLGIKRDT